ncbi:SdrD B-like domain-containing protein, partial [Herbaspirillum sp.]|uniref:SdrD B-like domain-containing protein n=1 Tax=Herbaspirillum sp. TaxID=1890675 RepID=UPI002588AF51
GYYGFTGLSPDDYVVEFELPEGYSFTGQYQGTDDAGDSDADTTTGRTGTVTLSAGENNLTVDAGMVTPALASLGDFVWYDADQDGVQGAGEPGISGVTVKLINPDTGAVIRTTATDGSGYYGFGSLAPGSYAVEFELPAGYSSFTGRNQGTDDAADSDADTATGRTETVTLSAGDNNLTVDAGMFSPTEIAGLGDFVWQDTDEDGIQDVGEPGISDVTVNLRDADTDKLISTTTTDSSGYYGFTGLSPD